MFRSKTQTDIFWAWPSATNDVGRESSSWKDRSIDHTSFLLRASRSDTQAEDGSWIRKDDSETDACSKKSSP